MSILFLLQLAAARRDRLPHQLQQLQRRAYEHGESSNSCPITSDPGQPIHLPRPEPHEHTEESCGDLGWRGSFCANGLGKGYWMACAKDWYEEMHGRPRDPDNRRVNFSPDLAKRAKELDLRTETGRIIGKYFEIRRFPGKCPKKTWCLPLDNSAGGWHPWSKRPMPRIACVPGVYVRDKLNAKSAYNHQKALKRKADKLKAAQGAVEDEQEKRRRFEADQTPEELAALEAAERVRLQALVEEFAAVIEVRQEIAAEDNVEPFPLPPDFGYDVFSEPPSDPSDEDWEHAEYIAGLTSNFWDDAALLAQAASYGALELTDPTFFPPPGCGGKVP